jgi:hypothetical protein
LGVPLGISSFTSSFIKNVLLEDVRHVDLSPKMGDVQVGFGIIIHCFVQQPSYFLQCTFPSSTFIDSLCRNPSLGFVIKARVCKGEGQEGSSRVTSHVLKSVE